MDMKNEVIDQGDNPLQPDNTSTTNQQRTHDNTENSIKLPSYIDKAFIEAAICKTHPNVTVKSMTVSPAVPAGENYMSLVFRVAVETNKESFHLIIKCVPDTEFRIKLINEGQFSDKERNFYSNTLNILEMGLSDDTLKPNIPKFYFHLKDDNKDVLIMQDLKPFGCKTTDRHVGLDYDHLKLAVIELAKFHSLSLRLRINDPEEFEKQIVEPYPETIYSNELRHVYETLNITSIKAATHVIRKYLPFRYEKIADIIEKVTPFYFNWVTDLLKMDKNDLDSDRVLVLNHGDYWSNNILYQYESTSTKPLRSYMVDFQMSRCNSPVCDITYLITCCTTKDMRDNHLNEFLQLYLNTVHDTLKAYNIETPVPKNIFYSSLQELKNDLKKNMIYTFIVANWVMPIMISTKEANLNMDDLNDDLIGSEESPFIRLFKNPVFTERYQNILNELDDEGFFVYLAQKLAEMSTNSE